MSEFPRIGSEQYTEMAQAIEQLCCYPNEQTEDVVPFDSVMFAELLLRAMVGRVMLDVGHASFNMDRIKAVLGAHRKNPNLPRELIAQTLAQVTVDVSLDMLHKSTSQLTQAWEMIMRAAWKEVACAFFPEDAEAIRANNGIPR